MAQVTPLCIDLYCGLGGWAEGFLSEDYDVIGFDIERHDYGIGGYPGQLVLQDVTTLDGARFKDAAVIVASPPCQAYSYRAMPWKRAKALPPPDNTLFDACFRIQREASAAAGHKIPMVVENVCGAQKWVGRAKWHYGSYYLWGDVPALMPWTQRAVMKEGVAHRNNGETNFHGSAERATKVPGLNWSGSDKPGYVARAFNTTAEQRLTKNNGGSWFNVAHNTASGHGQNPDGRKNGGDWFSSGEGMSLQRAQSSKSSARKAASARIAMIPLPLASWIAKCFKPNGESENAENSRADTVQVPVLVGDRLPEL